MEGFNLLNRWWGVLPLLALVWHGLYTVFVLSPDYLLFVCYTANLLLGVGILIRSGLLIGAGYGWILLGFPLWLYDMIRTWEWDVSGIVFHTCGLLVGGMALRGYRIPKYTWFVALCIAVSLQVLARFFTDPLLNVNAAFRVYDGWDGLFSDYRLYTLVMLVGFGLFFAVATVLSNRFVFRGRASDGTA